MQIQLQKFTPPSALQRYIRFYYTVSFEPGAKDIQLDNHPQGTMDIMFVFRGEANFGTSTTEKHPLTQVFIIGQQTSNFSFQFDPKVQALGVTFTAEGFAKIFRMPMKELTATGVDALALLDKKDQLWIEQLAELPGDRARIQLLNQIFTQKIHANDLPFDGVDEAIQWIRNVGGQGSMLDLAHHFNMSLRTLQRKFVQKVGVSPKTYARVIRFNYMMRLLRQSSNINWQDVLYEAGYFDQMHFIKEFKKFTGHTPTQFVTINPKLSEFFLHDG